MLLRDQKGQALLFTAFMASLILVLVTGSLAVAGSHRRNVVRQEQQVQVYYIAEAGLERAVARIKAEPGWLDGIPPGVSVRLDDLEGPYAGGEIAEVTLQKVPWGMGFRVDLTSVGKLVSARKTLRASLYSVSARSFLGGLSLLPESPLDLDIKGNFLLEGSGNQTGRLLLNGNLYLSGNAAINGDVYVSGEVTGRDKVTGQVNSGFRELPGFPAMDLTYYEEEARRQGRYYDGNLSWSGTIQLDGVYYVAGNAYLSGTYSGQGIIVVRGNVYFTGNLSGSLGSALAVIALGDVDVKNHTVKAAIITEGTLYLQGNAVVEGAILAKGTNLGAITGNITIRYSEEGIPLGLLGGLLTELEVLSWKEAYPIF
ncbi:MAG: Uncharacterized protein XD51_1268 [Moorella sp. 60_41]|nr:MAG: Uncharacterized protein XD51_1268 [Moorella sp. 60_41]